LLAGYRHLLAAGRRLQWDADQIDLGTDRQRWAAADEATRGRLAELLAGFWVAERQVAEQLEPFIAEAEDVAQACFELQSSDEQRHARFFDRILREVVGVDPERDGRALAGEPIVELFDRELPAMAAALAGREVELGEAVGLYHLVLEAIVLSMGQEALLAYAGGLPGIADGVGRVQADERWHIGLGAHALGESGSGPPSWLDAVAERAAVAWGREIATPERTERLLAAHRRRTALLARAALPRG
jgi:ribonucleoside-diphosphate reductase beta chain